MKETSIPNFRIFTFLLVSFLIGIFLSSFFMVDFYFAAVVFGIVFLLQMSICFIFNQPFQRILLICSIGFMSGWLLFAHRQQNITVQIPYGNAKNINGTIISYPNSESTTQNFYLKTFDFDKSTKIYVSTSRYPSYSYGDVLKISGKLEKPTNFSTFDWVNYLMRYGSVSQIRNPEVEVIGKNHGNKTLELLYSIRKKFELVLKKSLPEPESSLSAGLLIGSKQGFSDSLLSQFSKVGVTHIIALSGFNVTIIIIFITELMLGYVERRKIFAISTILIFGFVAMTGAAPSVIRAAIITLLITFGKTIGRRADMTNLILLSAAIMVGANPYILRFDLGFQLSFLAFLGLVYFSPIVKHFFARKVFHNIPTLIKTALTETLSAQIFVLPLILYTFGLVSIIAPVTNLLILPIVPMTMLFIFISTIFYWMTPWLGHLAFLITYLPLRYIIQTVKFFAQMAYSSVTINGVWRIAMTILTAILIIIILFKNRFIYDKKIS